MNKQELYDLKIKVIKMMRSSEGIAKIVASLESDSEKIDWLYRTKNPKGKAEVIASLKVSDDEKIKLLRMLLYPKDKAIALASLESDQKKIELLDIIKSNTEYAQARVIESLKTDEAKITCLSRIENIRVRAKIIASLDSDEKKVELIGTVKDEYEHLPGLIIASIKSRELKEKLMATLTRENIKQQIRERIEEEELESKSEEEIIRYIREQKGRKRQGNLIARFIKREKLQYEMFKECRVGNGSVQHSRSVYYLQSVGLLGKSDDEKIQHIVTISTTREKYSIPAVLESLSGDGLATLISQYPEIYKDCVQGRGKIELLQMIEQLLSIQPREKQRNPLEDMSIEELQGMGDKLAQEIAKVREEIMQNEERKRQELISSIEGSMDELSSLKEELARLEAQKQMRKVPEDEVK